METTELILKNVSNDIFEEQLCEDNSSRMNGILNEFTKLYTEKLDRISGNAEDELKLKVSVLENWVTDLGDQNGVLVATVEQLEAEASRRVALLQAQLHNMASITRDNCAALTDHQKQMDAVLKEKALAEDEVTQLQSDVTRLQEKVYLLQQETAVFEAENNDLRHDLDSALRVICRGRSTGKWDISDISFMSVKAEELFESSSLTLNEGRLESLRSDYGSTTNESDVKSANNVGFAASATIVAQKDARIAQLQCDLTELHAKLCESESHVESTTAELRDLIQRGRHDSVQISRRDGMIRHLLSPTMKASDEPHNGSLSRPNSDIELALSENIDVMALCLSDLDNDCEHLKCQNVALKENHTKCTHTIVDLTEKLDLAKKIALQMESELEDWKLKEERVREELLRKEGQIEKLRKDIESLKNSSSQQNLGNKQTQTVINGNLDGHCSYTKSEISKTTFSETIHINKLENELSEKNILIRDLQNHLLLSREELQLKDETIFNIEKKLDHSRRGVDEREERMLYLTSQLTNLQLELSRLHGTAQQLRIQLESKSELVLKLECENRCLVRRLNEKSSTQDEMQKEASSWARDMTYKDKQISEQKIMISQLQDALLNAKMTSDKLQNQIASEKFACISKMCPVRGRSSSKTKTKPDCKIEIHELIEIIDELSHYLKETEFSPNDVDKKCHSPARQCLSLSRDVTPDFYLQEMRQKHHLCRFKEKSSLVMNKLNSLKKDVMKQHQIYHDDCYDFLLEKNNNSSMADLFPRQKMNDAPEIELMKNKLGVLEHQFEKERGDKEGISSDANSVISYMRDWLQFQKITNLELYEKYKKHEKEICILRKENRMMSDDLFQWKISGHGMRSLSPKDDRHISPTRQDESLTNDTGFDATPIARSSSPVASLSPLGSKNEHSWKIERNEQMRLTAFKNSFSVPKACRKMNYL